MPRSFPALLLGLIIVAYWARVARLVYKIRRRTGKSANPIPTEPLGLLLRFAWYPVVIVWIIHPLYSAYASRPPRAVIPLWTHPLISWGCLALAAACFAATWVCWKKMGTAWRMGINPDEKTQLIVSGPYAFVRHPIYALSSLLMLCTMAMLPSPLMLLVGFIHLGLLQWEARREEEYLAIHHGRPYLDYQRHVGRFLPRSLRPYNV